MNELVQIIRDQTSVVSVSARQAHMANLHISNSGAQEFRASIWADHFGSRDGANVTCQLFGKSTDRACAKNRDNKRRFVRRRQVFLPLSFAGALSSLIAAAFGARHREPVSRTRC